jgi:RimJ/RimL family protein N-acetyltransferase
LTNRAHIVPIRPEHIEGYRSAVDIVARERKYLTLLEAFPLAQTRDFALALVARGDPIFVAVAGSAVIGWCDIQRHAIPAHAHRGTLGMGIVPGHRGRGVGLVLIETALQRALASGFTRIELNVRADNLAAIKLYEKVGFAHEGVLRDAVLVDGAYHDSLAMAKLARRS